VDVGHRNTGDSLSARCEPQVLAAQAPHHLLASSGFGQQPLLSMMVPLLGQQSEAVINPYQSGQQVPVSVVYPTYPCYYNVLDNET
jgi:hypothetical protein